MQSNITLVNSTESQVNAGEEVFLRSIPAQIQLNELTTEALRLLVYYVAKQGPYNLAIASGYFEGTLAQWLQSLKASLTLKTTVGYYHELAQLTGLSQGDMVYVKETDLVYFYDGTSFAAKESGLRIVGQSAYQVALETGYVGTEEEWLATLKGDAFRFEDFTSEQLDLLIGPTGMSAFEHATEQGFSGTLTQWLDSLVGPKGDKGDQGTAGLNGKSAYQLAVENGFLGTSDAWLATLKGDKGERGYSAFDIALQEGYVGNHGQWLEDLIGDSAYEIATQQGFIGTIEEWVESLRGRTAYEQAVAKGFVGSEMAWLNSLVGKSAYQSAVANGYVGTQVQWLQSLVGKSAYELDVQNGYEGDLESWLEYIRGKSAYRIAVDNGYVGSAEEWLASLKGASAYTIAVANGFNGTITEWLTSLKGTDGVDGISPPSNYDIYVQAEMDKILTRIEWADLQATSVGLDAYNAYVATVVEPDVPMSQAFWAETLKNSAEGATAYAAYTDAQVAAILTSEAWVASITGPAGTNGVNGKSAYELYVAQETSEILTRDAWADLQGTLETNALYDAYVATVVDPDVPLTQLEWAETLKTSPEGATAYTSYYDTAIAAILTQEAWLLTLVGPQGVVDSEAVGAIVLGTTQGQSATPITDTDTLLVIIGKLQAQITDLEARVAALETP